MNEYKVLFENIEVKEDMTNQFKEIAQSLFNNFIIKANDNKYRLSEIEFYMHVNKIHPDTFIHAKAKDDINEANSKQSKMGLWYFHYSGIDLTFGNEKDRYGGILIRSIVDINTGRKIKGPLKLKNQLLNNYTSFTSGKPFLQLQFNKSEKIRPIEYVKPRVNLGKENNEKYKSKSYNFSIK